MEQAIYADTCIWPVPNLPGSLLPANSIDGWKGWWKALGVNMKWQCSLEEGFSISNLPVNVLW